MYADLPSMIKSSLEVQFSL